MDWYYYIAWVAIVLQLLFLLQMYRNWRYATSRYIRKRNWYIPKTVLIVPCKGIDLNFEKNIASFFNQEYENYLLWFVVAEKTDPAYEQLCRLKDQLAATSKALDVQILIAGHTDQDHSCSQKVHNLLCAYNQIADDIEVMAFADSDICIRPDWLSHIVYPLRLPTTGAASGYRWFIPKTNNPATLALSAVNAKIAQLLGNTLFNQAWGGSMAIKVEVFRKIGLDKIWENALSDDFSLSYAVKRAHLKVIFVPACLVASYETTTWKKFFEFARRQFLITRITYLGNWLFGLFSSVFVILGLWAGLALAIYAASINAEHQTLFIAVPVVFFICQLARAILRQTMIAKILSQHRNQMKISIAADVLLFWLWAIVLLIVILSSALGRTIRWRGIRYKLISPTETIVLS